ncbi:DUF6153 family protein [Streptomyces sp. NPDC051322]|uniref:DUF6153 family protein n=1 Tax=Streptomyces sp. NPDC051322 TaxID=3154645 RepID=UPI00344CB3C0
MIRPDSGPATRPGRSRSRWPRSRSRSRPGGWPTLIIAPTDVCTGQTHHPDWSVCRPVGAPKVIGVSTRCHVVRVQDRPYDGPVKRSCSSTGVRPAGRAWAVLVLAVLAGLLAMHALAPGGATPMNRPAGMAATVAGGPAVHAAPAMHRIGHRGHATSTGSGGGMRMHHADSTCAAGGISTAYAPPALAPAVSTPASASVVWPGTPGTEAVDGRAPPDLAQLQLLQI